MALVIFRIFLFILPFVLFYLWIRYLRQVKKGEIEPNPEFVARLRMTTIGFGVILISGIIYLVVNSDTNEDKVYVPPQTIDGEIKPGHFEEKEKPKGDNG